MSHKQADDLASDNGFKSKISDALKCESASLCADAIISDAYASRASDIHIEPCHEGMRVRYRIDGDLSDVCVLPNKLHGEMISRIKILCGLRTDEHRFSQDGRFCFAVSSDIYVDVRASIVPTYYGENCILRLLANMDNVFSLAMLGLSKEDCLKVENAIGKSSGCILVTGPTGSGKTTTLYTLVKMLNKPNVSIITIEDPIEYSITGVSQIQVNHKAGLTFANGLRAMLRQDPNIIMVGEVRDTETAALSINAALTGHIVLSTLHTNDAPTTLPRLLDMQVEPYLIASTVTLVVGQRLMRKLCDNCKAERIFGTHDKLALEGFVSREHMDTCTKVFDAEGCAECNGTGYSKRIGSFEIMEMNDELRDMIIRKSSARDLRAVAIRHGMTPIIEDGFAKVRDGVSTVTELLRVKYA